MLDGETLLVARAIEGESSAFGELYDYYQPKIYRFVFIRVGHREDAEDLTHQVFTSAWESICRYEPRGIPFSSWLYRIARNRITDYYRTKKATYSFEEVVDALPPVLMNDIEDGVDQRLALEKVTRAIRSLKNEYYQDVIVMRFVEDFSIKEIASALGKSEGAVKLLEHRALRALRKTLLS